MRAAGCRTTGCTVSVILNSVGNSLPLCIQINCRTLSSGQVLHALLIGISGTAAICFGVPTIEGITGLDKSVCRQILCGTVSVRTACCGAAGVAVAIILNSIGNRLPLRIQNNIAIRGISKRRSVSRTGTVCGCIPPNKLIICYSCLCVRKSNAFRLRPILRNTGWHSNRNAGKVSIKRQSICLTNKNVCVYNTTIRIRGCALVAGSKAFPGNREVLFRHIRRCGIPIKSIAACVRRAVSIFSDNSAYRKVISGNQRSYVLGAGKLFRNSNVIVAIQEKVIVRIHKSRL